VPGARFKGRNRRGGIGGTPLNEVAKADRARELVWRTVPSGPYPDSVESHLSLAEEQTGTRVTESFEVVTMSRLMEWLAAVAVAVPTHRDRTGDLTKDLARLKLIVESAEVS
jgi:hypothetical protein